MAAHGWLAWVAGCTPFLQIIVVSPKFEGVSLLDRQRNVNAALEGFQHRIHATSVKAWTEETWRKRTAAAAAAAAGAP